MTKTCYRQVKRLRANPLFRAMSFEAVCMALLLDDSIEGEFVEETKQHIIDIVRTIRAGDVHD